MMPEDWRDPRLDFAEPDKPEKIGYLKGTLVFLGCLLAAPLLYLIAVLLELPIAALK